MKEGYIFSGWFTDEDCTKTWDFANGMPGDITLYARWNTAGIATPVTGTQTAATVLTAVTTSTAGTTTAAASSVVPTLTHAPAPLFGSWAGLFVAGVFLRRRA